MDSTNAQDWLKLCKLLDRACSSLRELFTKSFQDTFGCEWSQSVSHLITDHKEIQRLSLWHRQKLEEGNCNEWDITFLREIMMTKDLLRLTSNQLAGIKQIVEIRNKMKHLPSSSVTLQEFNAWWTLLGQSLVGLGTMSEIDLEQLRQEQFIDGVELVASEENVDRVNSRKAAHLREKGNFAFKTSNYFRAVELYAEAIELSGLSSADRALLYANRCSAYVWQFQADRHKDRLPMAKRDAQKAVELNNDWWMGHLCLGQVYTAMEKFEKAEQCFGEAMSKELQNQTIIDAISSLRNKQGQHDRMDYLDPRNIPKSTADYVDDLTRKTGSKINSKFVKIMENMALTCGDPEFMCHEFCRLGHRCRVGLDGMPRDNQLAAKYYEWAAHNGSAEGMYNLGQMILDGEGVQQNFKSGIKLLLEAAAKSPTDECGLPRLGVAEAEHLLGLCYERGIGVSKDAVQAIMWYERSMYNGCPNAANNLGLIHEIGIVGGKPNLVKAEQFYQLAARSGRKADTNAMINLARLYEKKGDLERAFEYCRRAKENGNVLPVLDQLRDKLKIKMDEFADSGIPTWEVENSINSSDLTIKERVELYYREHIPHFDALVKHLTIVQGKLKTPLLTCIQTEKRFNPTLLEKCAKYSVYGQSLWTAKQHFLAAFNILLEANCDVASLDIGEKFVKRFAAGAQIELMVSELSATQCEQALEIISYLLEKRLAFDEDVRVCYIALKGFVSPESIIKFLDPCVREYPQNVYFLEWRASLNAFLGNYEDAIRDVNAALKLDPNNVEILYDRAAMLRLATPNIIPQASISDYEQFLELAPKDHRKFPEAFYSLAVLKLPQIEAYEKLQRSNVDGHCKELEQHFIELKRYYDFGMTAETEQLPCFLPYESNNKAIIEAVLSMAAHIPFFSSLFLPSRTFPTNTNSTLDLCLTLSDPNRILRIKQHREAIRKVRQIMSMGKDTLAGTRKPLLQQTMPPSLSNFKAITIRDMDPTQDLVYNGCLLSVTVIDEICFTGFSLCMIVEDTDGYVERCCVYNWSHMKDAALVEEVFGPGTIMTIINPYMRMAHDCKPTIRVDDPTTVILQGSIPDMCRYCCKPNAHMLCPSCKNARYCSDTCSALDGKEYAHDLICKWDGQWPIGSRTIVAKQAPDNCDDGVFNLLVTKGSRLAYWLSFVWCGSFPRIFATIRALYSYVLLFRFLKNKATKVKKHS